MFMLQPLAYGVSPRTTTTSSGSRPALMATPSSPRAPQFGWSWDAHAHIEQAATQRLPASGFRQFLEQHMPAINQCSKEEDTLRMGPRHYLDLEALPGRGTTRQANKDAYQRFQNASPAFSPGQKQAVQAQFQQQPLHAQEAHQHAPQNVIRSSMEAYQELVRLLQQPAPHSDTHQRRLEETIGALAHFVADLHQPLHTSHYFTWDLMYPDHGTAHGFMELNIFKPDDYAQWATQLPPSPLRVLNANQIEHELLRAVEQSYLQIFDLMQADRQARATRPTAQEYFQTLGQAWKPMMDVRMQQATALLASILHSAHLDATGQAPGTRAFSDGNPFATRPSSSQ